MFAEKRKKRHRPQSLDLSSDSSVALRIVSPGLPPLDEEMENTVKISQRIEQQQRHLIAARQSATPTLAEDPVANDDSESEGSDNRVDANQDVNQDTSLQNGVDLHDDTDRLETLEPQLTKETTKEKVIENEPAEDAQDVKDGTNAENTALDESVSSTSENVPLDPLDKLSTPASAKRLKRNYIPSPLTIPLNPSQPSIQSAPIRPGQRYPHTATGTVFPQGRSGFPLQYVGQPGMLVPRYQTPTYYYPQQPVYSRYYRPFRGQAALSPVVQAQYLGYQRRRPGQVGVKRMATSSGNIDKVTDVYHGDYTRAAPLLSQPLLAQCEFFESKRGEQDDDRLPVSEEEVREMQEKYKQVPRQAKREQDAGEIFGSINFMNECMFNFKIFKNKDEDVDVAEKRLAGERTKFLKICETSWDEFVNARKDG